MVQEFFSGVAAESLIILGGAVGWVLYGYQRHINNNLKMEIERLAREFRAELARERQSNLVNREALKAIIETMQRNESSKVIAAEVKKKVDAIFERAEKKANDNDRKDIPT